MLLAPGGKRDLVHRWDGPAGAECGKGGRRMQGPADERDRIVSDVNREKTTTRRRRGEGVPAGATAVPGGGVEVGLGVEEHGRRARGPLEAWR